MLVWACVETVNTGLNASAAQLAAWKRLETLALVPWVLGAVPGLLFAIVLGSLGVTFMFVARGLLFLELTTSSRRAREFQRRTSG